MFGLIRQLAMSNLIKNRSLYYPFVLAVSFTVAIFYIFTSLTFNPNLQEIYGGAQIVMVMGLGLFIVAVASVAIVIYANGFVMKNRFKELGLYEILGLNKIHLVQMNGLELFFVAVACVGLGLGLGLLLDQLIYALLLKIIDWPVTLTSTFQWSTLVVTILVFAGIFSFVFVLNSTKLARFKALELNREGQKGEKRVRFLRLQTVLGLLLLGAGYYLANTVKDPVVAIVTFFLAVLLVMAATYLLFHAGITVFLRFLKKRETYYYQTKNFISTSNLIFRMRKNAMGLATIAILSTMVLVTLAGGTSIYLGTNSFIAKSNPNDVSLKMSKVPSDPIGLEDLKAEFNDFKDSLSVTPTKEVAYAYAAGSLGSINSKEISLYTHENKGLPAGILYVVDTKNYEALTGQEVELATDEVLASIQGVPFSLGKTIVLDGKEWHVASQSVADFVTDKLPDNLGGIIGTNMYLVVADLDSFLTELPSYDPTSDQLTSLGQYYYVALDAKLKEEQQLALEEPLQAMVAERLGGTDSYIEANVKAKVKKEITSLFGSLFFIGILLTMIFMLGTILVIYYKQISEGYEDRENFVILQKVGLDEQQTKQTIQKQVLVVFLLPLLCGFVHLAAAFHMLDKILHLFVPMTTGQILQVTVGICLVFVFVYLGVFALTSKQYRKIVSKGF